MLKEAKVAMWQLLAFLNRHGNRRKLLRPEHAHLPAEKNVERVYLHMIPKLPITHRDGIFSVMLQACTCRILTQILDPSVPFVWIRGHIPHPIIQWWHTKVPLSAKGTPYDVEVRLLEFDIQLTTSRFLELLPEFEDVGIDLC